MSEDTKDFVNFLKSFSNPQKKKKKQNRKGEKAKMKIIERCLMRKCVNSGRPQASMSNTTNLNRMVYIIDDPSRAELTRLG